VAVLRKDHFVWPVCLVSPSNARFSPDSKAEPNWPKVLTVANPFGVNCGEFANQAAVNGERRGRGQPRSVVRANGGLRWWGRVSVISHGRGPTAGRAQTIEPELTRVRPKERTVLMSFEGWPPRECGMPDLAGLNPKLSVNLALQRLVGKYDLPDPRSYALVMSYIRLVDQLVHAYQCTRSRLIEFLETPPNVISPLIFATNHCESLLTAMLRVINLGDRIRRDQNGPPIAKTVEVFRSPVWKRVSAMRNAIEHVDSEIVRNTWKPDGPAMLLLKNDRLALPGAEITYTDLAKWLQQLHAVGTDLLAYEPPKAGAP
jgi:hypothetical protein